MSNQCQYAALAAVTHRPWSMSNARYITFIYCGFEPHSMQRGVFWAPPPWCENKIPRTVNNHTGSGGFQWGESSFPDKDSSLYLVLAPNSSTSKSERLRVFTVCLLTWFPLFDIGPKARHVRHFFLARASEFDFRNTRRVLSWTISIREVSVRS